METRLRMLLYEGEHHTTPEGVLRDAGRYTRLVDRGWRIYTKYEIRDEQERIVVDRVDHRARKTATRVPDARPEDH